MTAARVWSRNWGSRLEWDRRMFGCALFLSLSSDSSSSLLSLCNALGAKFGFRFVLVNWMGLIWLNRWRILKGDLNHEGT